MFREKRSCTLFKQTIYEDLNSQVPGSDSQRIVHLEARQQHILDFTANSSVTKDGKGPTSNSTNEYRQSCVTPRSRQRRHKTRKGNRQKQCKDGAKCRHRMKRRATKKDLLDSPPGGTRKLRPDNGRSNA
jgi:hypothetical protein